MVVAKAGKQLVIAQLPQTTAEKIIKLILNDKKSTIVGGDLIKHDGTYVETAIKKILG